MPSCPSNVAQVPSLTESGIISSGLSSSFKENTTSLKRLGKSRHKISFIFSQYLRNSPHKNIHIVALLLFRIGDCQPLSMRDLILSFQRKLGFRVK